MSIVNVIIPTVDTWPSREEMTARNSVIEALTSAGLGSCIGAGGGCGQMDFTFKVTDTETSSKTIDQVIHTYMPGVSYRIQEST